MDIVRARELIALLSEGYDPLTGEILPDDHVCNQPDMIRAFYAIVDFTKDCRDDNEIRSKKKKKASFPQNAGKIWKKEEDEKLCEMFDRDISKKEICDYFKRTERGISSRLVRLGKINYRDEFEKRE